MTPPYAELHLHTAFSFLDGASLPEELVERALELGYRHLAVTDHDGLHGAMEFARAAHAAGIAPITGAELTLADGSHLTLLAQSRAGHANLCRLLTAAHHRRGLPGAAPGAPGATDDGPPPPPNLGGSYDGRRPRLELPPGLGGGGGPSAVDHYRDPLTSPRLDPALLPAHAAGLVLLTGCRHGRLSQLVDADRLPEAAALLRDYTDWFGPDNVVVELQHNLVHGDARRVARLVALAEQVGLPYAATGNVHYHRRERHRLQDTLVAIRHNTTLDGCHRQRRPNAEFALRSPAEVAAVFRRYPQALRTAVDIAERCAAFDLARDLDYRFPDFPTPTGEPAAAHLARVCADALDRLYPPGHPHHALAQGRAADELRLIAARGLDGFFLVYRDILELAREVAAELRGEGTPRAAGNLPPGRGRGSSVSSIVCYLIGLSPVDPLAHDLFPGRFLNEATDTVPDIDLDFPRDIREKLIERVYARYPGRAALVCAFSTYRLRSAVRDVGKALGLPAADLDRVARLSEPRSAEDLAEELDRIPEFAARKHTPPWSHLVDLAGQLAGFPRHVTQHVGGMVVAAAPIDSIVPVQPAAMDGRYLCQWDKDSADDAGFVKIDFLALGMLSLVEECLELIHASGSAAGKPPLDLSRIDFRDEPVFEMIRAGDTIGVFQIESRAQIQMLTRTRPETLDDLVVQVAIVRPGPIIGGAVTPYVQRREQRGAYVPVFDHPCLEPVLRETLGVILYQEQVIEVAMKLAGFTAGQADQLRRSMTRKRSHEAMASLRQTFRDGAHRTHGLAEAAADAVFDKLIGFAAYGFPKCHAAAFALLAYQSCWLKHHHPAEFLCALLNNQPMGFYPPHVLANDARRHRIRMLPPDINQSAVRCTVEAGPAVRLGLGHVAGLSDETAARVVAERADHGDFVSLADFVRRVPLRAEATEALIVADAFARFGLGRREALWQLGLFVPARGFGPRPAPSAPGAPAPSRPTKDRGRQLPLALPTAQDAVELPPMPAWERMAADYETLGLSPAHHPLGLLRPRLPARLFATVADLAAVPHGAPVQVAGLVVCRQRPGTAKGITFLLLEDEHGLINVVVYPDLYDRQRLLVRGEPFLAIEGSLQRTGANLNLLARRLHRLDAAYPALAPNSGTDSGMDSGMNSGTHPPAARDIDVLAAGRGPQTPARADEPALALAPASHNYR